MELKFDSLTGLPQIQHFLNNQFRDWLQTIFNQQYELDELVHTNDKLIGVMKDQLDHMVRKESDRVRKVLATMRDINSLDQVQSYEINRLKERVDELEKKCAACKCNESKPVRKKK